MYDGVDRRGGGQARPDRPHAGRPPQGQGPYSKNSQRGQEQQRKKKLNKAKLILGVKTFFVRLAVMLVIVGLLGLWWYRAEFFSSSSRRSGKVTFTVESVGSYETDASLAYVGDVLYVDFSALSQWLELVSVGSVNSMRFICPRGIGDTSAGIGGEEYAIFKSGGSTARVNGTAINLEAPCRTVDAHIWVPLSFVENYISGIECDRGAKGTDIRIIPDGLEDLEEDEELVISVAFKVKAQTPLTPVKYPE